MNYHVRVANGDRSREAREGFLLHCYVVAGKTAAVQVEKLNNLLAERGLLSPFEYLSFLHRTGSLLDAWRAEKLGKYTTAAQGLPLLLEVDPYRVTVEELERIPGIGPKTARYYALYARGKECAALDTHILKFLRDMGVQRVPRTTPAAGKGYRRLEKVFIEIAHEFGLTAREMDDVVWRFYSGHIEEILPGVTQMKPVMFFTMYAKTLQDLAA